MIKYVLFYMDVMDFKEYFLYHNSEMLDFGLKNVN